jgi:predicted DsbA family dithiol-disulfide isomerase
MLIDVYSDVVCPWCYIGERRLQGALRERPDLAVERRWRPFQLQPGMPADGMPWAEFSRRKFGGESGARAAFERVAAAGEPDGVRFDFDRVASAPNTVDAHRLILLSEKRGLGERVSEALFEAYFAGGADLNDHPTLIGVAAGAGLDADEARAYLASDAGADEVWASQQRAADLGIAGVPFYVFDGRYAISGAQPLETFVRTLDAARDGAG